MPEFQHAFPFDPRYGFTEETLLKVTTPSEAPDFAEFWQATYMQAMATPLNIERRRVNSPNPNLELFEIEYDGLGAGRVGGWLTVPKVEFSRAVVVGHGYGGRGGPDERVPGPAAASIFPCARGFDRSAAPGIPGTAAFHVLHGIESRETYIHRFCAADLWSAASVLLDLFPHVKSQLDYLGASFGGGMGALAVPWDARIRRAFLDIPSFGNHPMRVTMQCVGSGEAVRLLYKRKPDVLSVLRYFDSAVAAKHIRIPTLVACALFDPAVPPPGQFAVYNSIPGQKELYIRPAAHFDYSGGAKADAALFQQLEQWFS